MFPHIKLHVNNDRPGVRQVLEGIGEQRKMEAVGCEAICGAPKSPAVKGQVKVNNVLRYFRFRGTSYVYLRIKPKAVSQRSLDRYYFSVLAAVRSFVLSGQRPRKTELRYPDQQQYCRRYSLRSWESK